MSFNTFGRIFRVTTWGESHGPALGCVVDGCPPGVRLEPEMLQHWLDRRKPGQNRYTTQRKEPDQVKILSGVFEDERTDGPRTTGSPISLMIENTDQRSKDYSEIRDKFRPGHADFAYHLKYGLRDYRGGGRSSARETAARVAAGGVAREALKLLEDVLMYRPHDPQLNERAAQVCMQLGQLEAAQGYVETLIERTPDAGQYHTLLGRIHRERGDADAAVSAFETALKLDEDDAEARRSLASIRLGARQGARGGT